MVEMCEGELCGMSELANRLLRPFGWLGAERPLLR